MNAYTVQKARRPAAWRQFHAIADRQIARLARAINQVFDDQQALVDMRALTAAIRIGSLPDAMAALNLPDDTIAKVDEWRTFKGVLRGLWQDGFELTEETVGRQIGLTARFDMDLPRAVQHLNAYQFELIQGIDAATRILLQDILGLAFTNPVGAAAIGIPVGNPRQTARTIQQFIGITERQAGTLGRFVEQLRENGASEDLIDKRRELYLKRMKRSRATTIARTETIRAASVGQQELWRQAADQGFLDANVARRIWFVTPDDDLCPICRPIPRMNPRGVALDQPFATPVGPVMFPPVHQNCRCAVSIVPQGEAAVPPLQKLPPVKPTPRGRSLSPSLNPGRKPKAVATKVTKTNPKKQARKRIEVALRNGTLKRGPCADCGTRKNVHAHHSDYSKPMKIKWLCPACHGREHAKKQQLESEENGDA